MKKQTKRLLAMLLAVAVALTLLPVMEGQKKRVEATSTTENAVEIPVSSYDELLNAAMQCVEMPDIPVVAKLSDSIEGIKETISLFAGELTVDLNGNEMTGTTSFFMVGSDTTDGEDMGARPSLTIANGNMTCTGATTAAVEVSGGDLVISSGVWIKGSGKCIVASNANVDITDDCIIGMYETSGETLSIDSNCTVNVNMTASGELGGCGDAVLHVTGTGNTINIENESKIFNQQGLYGISGGSAVLIEGTENQVNISGGNLNSQDGDALVLGSGLNDEDITISGGTFETGGSGSSIVRKVPEGAERNYFSFYGDESRQGIIADGYVLTENTFTTTVENGEAIIRTYDTPQNVFEGCLVEFQTGRSTLENAADSAQADEAEYYSLSPVSIDKDGNVYYYFVTGTTTPDIVTDRVTNGNTYTFRSWRDEKGNEYASIDDFIDVQSDFTSNKVLHAVWDAKASTADGFESAMQNTGSVKDIKLTDNISTWDYFTAGEADIPSERTLDLGENTIECFSTDTPALVMNDNWKVQNGNIESDLYACIQVNGTAVLDNLNCKAKRADCAVEFCNVTADSSNRILSGTYETAKTNGYAIKAINSSQTGTAQDITNLLQDAYASTTKTKIEGANVYLDTLKLLVSQTPITYIDESGVDIPLGTYTYGDESEVIEQSISNQEYMGDIIVTGVSVDNPAFEVTGEMEITGDGGTKTLTGGSEDTYSYMVEAAAKAPVGTHEGKVSVHYVRMDGTSGEYKQLVSMTILPKQLTVEGSVVSKTKTYDGTVTAAVTSGALQDVLDGDDVSVTAAAVYDNANAGTGKTITVKYLLSGDDKDNYLAPEDISYTDGVINKAAGTGAVTIADYHVGEESAVPKPVSDTNGVDNVTFSYKQQGAADDTYTADAPADEGNYTVKAVFAETSNYYAVEVTADFTVSYIDTPAQPYTLGGTKGDGGWYRTGVTVQPAQGYTISTEQKGTYTDSYTVDTTASPVIYLKNGNGAVTRAIQVETIQIDKVTPLITGVDDGAVYYSDAELTAVVSDENLYRITLNGETVSFAGTSQNVLLPSSDSESVLSVEDKAGNTTTYTVTVKKHIYEVTAEEADFGTRAYGNSFSQSIISVSNEKSTGDIVITGVSIDTEGSSAFDVIWNGEPATITAGKTAEVYTVSVKSNLVPGIYKGTVQVSYKKLDGTIGTCQQSITVSVTLGVLSITEPTITKEKTYDGTKRAEVTAGILTGVVLGDEVHVTATAAYDGADAGTGKNITVSYELSGADKDKYQVLQPVIYKDGIIQKANGSANVTIESWKVGEQPKNPLLDSVTEGLGAVTYFYKSKNASEAAYSQDVPTEEGEYTVKAVFAESTNYKQTETTGEFSISYIDTPKNPYILTGEKGKNGWYISDVTISPAEGFTLSMDRNGTYKASCVLESSINAQSVYLKSETGAVTRAIDMGEVLIDKEAPVITGIGSEQIYYSDALSIEITDSNLSQVLLNGQAVTINAGRTEINLNPSDEKYIISAEDGAGHTVEYSFLLEEAWMKEGIISSGIKTLKPQKEYKLGSGQWQVSGDSTVYNGGTNIYVPAGGDYDFQKQ